MNSIQIEISVHAITFKGHFCTFYILEGVQAPSDNFNIGTWNPVSKYSLTPRTLGPQGPTRWGYLDLRSNSNDTWMDPPE
jgi:hypothetical protein